ncbi:MAG TPA: hypothetical protein VLX90_00350, partial [Steroidobacteraceae bacterium]|nr:hypothetical protein [Steroidobacteraceae bacterium]
EPSALSIDQRRLRILTDFFLAISDLARDPSGHTHDELLADARALLVDVGADQWMLPWVSYWVAQAAMAQNDLKRAYDECEQADTLGRQQGDLEAIAAAWQLRGDLRWRDGRLEDSTHSYVIALCVAFQLVTLIPDPYPKRFYNEMCDGAVRRLRMLWASGERGFAVHACNITRKARAGIAERLGVVVESADFAVLLDGGSDTEIRRALLLSLPDDAEARMRITLRAIRRMNKNLIVSLMASDSGDGPTAGQGTRVTTERHLSSQPSRLEDLNAALPPHDRAD